MAQGLVALGTGPALAGDWSVGLVVLDRPFLSDEGAGKSCHLLPPHTFGRGVILLCTPFTGWSVLLPLN